MAGERILIVEDEPRIAEVLARYLEAEGYRTERAKDGREALVLFRRFEPDLVLLDLMIPELDGLELTRRWRASSSVPIIIVTAKSSELDRVLGLELGADDYVTKPFSPREVVARVKAVLRRARGGGTAPRRLRAGELLVDADAFRAYCGEEELSLTPSEFRLLQALVAAAGRAMTRRELLDALGEAYVDERTVDAHIKNLRKKLGPCAERVETVRGVGYRVAP